MERAQRHALLRLLVEQVEAHPQTPEGIELYHWATVAVSANELVDVSCMPTIVFATDAGLEPASAVEVYLEVVPVMQMLQCRLGDCDYWVGWDEEIRVAIAWVEP
jgi:hypothetical protein